MVTNTSALQSKPEVDDAEVALYGGIYDLLSHWAPHHIQIVARHMGVALPFKVTRRGGTAVSELLLRRWGQPRYRARLVDLIRGMMGSHLERIRRTEYAALAERAKVGDPFIVIAYLALEAGRADWLEWTRDVLPEPEQRRMDHQWEEIRQQAAACRTPAPSVPPPTPPAASAPLQGRLKRAVQRNRRLTDSLQQARQERRALRDQLRKTRHQLVRTQGQLLRTEAEMQRIRTEAGQAVAELRQGHTVDVAVMQAELERLQRVLEEWIGNSVYPAWQPLRGRRVAVIGGGDRGPGYRLLTACLGAEPALVDGRARAAEVRPAVRAADLVILINGAIHSTTERSARAAARRSGAELLVCPDPTLAAFRELLLNRAPAPPAAQTGQRGRDASGRPNRAQRHQGPRSESLLAEALCAAGVPFLREAPLAGLRVDFLIKGTSLVVEVDGIYHLTSRKQARDRQRDQILTGLGYTVLRIPTNEIYPEPDRRRWVREIQQRATLSQVPETAATPAVAQAGEERGQAVACLRLSDQ